MDEKRGVLAGFVATSVLTSSDGLFGDHVEEKRISEAPVPREQSNDYKPLYERLQELKDKKDSEWKEKNNPFAPPKALDDEEMAFLETLETEKSNNEKKKVIQNQEDLAQFHLAKESSKTKKKNNGESIRLLNISALDEDISSTHSKQPLDNKLKQSESIIAVRVKRKAVKVNKKNPVVSNAKKQKTEQPQNTNVIEKKCSSLVAYSSDSSDSSDGDHDSGNE